jgi:excinuclease ABC subunit C
MQGIKRQMMAAAEAEDFELAATLRDRLKALEAVTAQQQVASVSAIDRDIIGFYREADEVGLAIVPVRDGRMQDSRTFVFNGQVAEDPEILSTFLTQLYGEDDYIPREVLLPFDLEAREILEDILRERAGRKVSIQVPQRGDKTRLIDLAAQTAKAALVQEIDQTRRADRVSKELQKILHMSKAPRSMECFDISNLLGRRAVASRVRFQDAKPFKEGYRRYRIKTLEEKPNDYGMMREVLERRIRRGIDEGDMPDLLVVDGGKGQLNVAVAVLRELGCDQQPVIGFAKPDAPDARSRSPILIDKIFVPGRKNPIVLPPWSPALRALQAMRDESHRFAITYHRSLRNRGTLKSVLDDIPGVGEKRRRLLLKTFGSVKRLKEADESSIAALEGIGPKLAAEITSFLRADQNRAAGPALTQLLDDQILDDPEEVLLDDEPLGEEDEAFDLEALEEQKAGLQVDDTNPGSMEV